jgi:hypothetical protein
MTKLPQQELPVARKNKQKLKFRINNNKARDHVIFKTWIQYCILLFFLVDGKKSGSTTLIYVKTLLDMQWKAPCRCCELQKEGV